jgi:hypothetical protein
MNAPRGSSHHDRAVGTALTFLGGSLLLIPSRLVFAPLGSAGSVAQMTGLLLLAWWLQSRVSGAWRNQLPVVGITTLIYLASTVASYVAAARRPIPPIEISAADRGLLSALAYTGIVLFTVDGLRRRSTLDSVLRRLVLCGGIIGLIGLLQFATGHVLIDYIEIPGLSTSSELGGLDSRGGLNRPSGTAIHPIEFGAVLTMLMPLALHYAMNETQMSWARRWLPVATMAGSIGVCISRSAMVSAALSLAILLPTWPKAVRRRAYVAIPAVLASFYLLIPGLLGTIAGLFTGIGEDTSAQSRTDSAQIALDFIPRAPWFGRGARTFLPSYRILDNQYLLSAIETGFVGVAAFLLLAASAALTVHRVRRLTRDPVTASLAQALLAAVVTATISTALYDAFSFPMAVTLFFLLLGACGALAMLERHAPSRTAALSVSRSET